VTTKTWWRAVWILRIREGKAWVEWGGVMMMMAARRGRVEAPGLHALPSPPGTIRLDAAY